MFYGYGYGGYYGGGFYSGYMYYLLFMLPGLLISLWAQFRVKSTYAKYDKIQTRQGLTGAQAARRILDMHGLYHIRVEMTSGHLSDHFDPRSDVIRLSQSTFGNATIGAVGVAAHECGHAIQRAENYAPASIRTAIVPVVNIGSSLAVPLIIAGLLFSNTLIWAGIILFSLAVVFQLVTLPVELDASKRAIQTLGSTGMLTEEENGGVKKVLSAAALTYLAALLTSLLQLMYYVALAGGRSNRRR